MAPPSNPPDNDAKTIESAKLMDWEPPKAQGLYDPQNEHEACGVGFIVAIDGKRNHKVGESANCVTVMSIIIIKLAFQCNNFNFVVGQTQKKFIRKVQNYFKCRRLRPQSHKATPTQFKNEVFNMIVITTNYHNDAIGGKL